MEDEPGTPMPSRPPLPTCQSLQPRSQPPPSPSPLTAKHQVLSFFLSNIFLICTLSGLLAPVTPSDGLSSCCPAGTVPKLHADRVAPFPKVT